MPIAPNDHGALPASMNQTSCGERANAKSAVNPELQRDSGYGP
jgi:hypothetical protein